jgi:RNA polymerase sigma-70 factor (ECF subfamily)
MRLARLSTDPESAGDPGASAPDALGDLMVRVGRGDEAAFAEVYDHLGPLVYGIVLRVLRDPAQTEEVTQEVLVEIWRLAPRYERSKGSPKSWAATIAHRRAVDRVRSEQSVRDRAERLGRQASEDHDVVADEVQTTLDVGFDRARVQRALGHLTRLQREAIELAYFGGHTYREVAVLLDTPEGTIKTRIRDGMSRLRDELGGA